MGFAVQLAMLIVTKAIEVLLAVVYAAGRALGAVAGSWWARRQRRESWRKNRKKHRSRRRR